MRATTKTSNFNVADGYVDAALEQPPGEPHAVDAELVAHALLRLVAEHPGTMGRLRAARILGGFPVPQRPAGSGEHVANLAVFAVAGTWTLRELTQLVDAMVRGGLLAQTVGARPTLVPTRSGFRALEALDQPL